MLIKDFFFFIKKNQDCSFNPILPGSNYIGSGMTEAVCKNALEKLSRAFSEHFLFYLLSIYSQNCAEPQTKTDLVFLVTMNPVLGVYLTPLTYSQGVK